MMRSQLKRVLREILTIVPNASSKGVRVLTYHDANKFREKGKQNSVSAKSLRSQIRVLSKQQTLSLKDTLEPNSFGYAVTVDDGLRSAFEIFLPILEEFSIPATFFIPTSFIGKPGFLNVDQIVSLSKKGFDIGSHGHTHRSFATLSTDELQEELTTSRNILEDITGRKVTNISYPFGTKADFDKRTEQAVASAGYSRAFTSQHGTVCPQHPFRIPRIKIERSDRLPTFHRILSGRIDKWKLIDSYGWPIQKLNRVFPPIEVTKEDDEF